MKSMKQKLDKRYTIYIKICILYHEYKNLSKD